jgi:hypothetical protein
LPTNTFPDYSISINVVEQPFAMQLKDSRDMACPPNNEFSVKMVSWYNALIHIGLLSKIG